MGSQHSERFNHDSIATRYDASVLNEEDPVRNGYNNVLNWVVARAGIRPTDLVVDLGIGTGNLSARLPQCASLTGVDVSSNMLRIARQKLADNAPALNAVEVEMIQADILDWSAGDGEFDVLVSTYAVHHLEPAEKETFLRHVASRLSPGGRLVFGDLAFANERNRTDSLEAWTANGQQHIVDTVNEEFFWDVKASVSLLSELGFQTVAEKLGTLSWGIAALRDD